MRYYYKKSGKELIGSFYGEIYICDHPVYGDCTLYLIGKRGLAIIQQRYNSSNKTTWWGRIDDYLRNDIYLHPRFKTYFDEKAGVKDKNNLYPTVTIRQIMWGLRMKPLKREVWETCFDHSPI